MSFFPINSFPFSRMSDEELSGKDFPPQHLIVLLGHSPAMTYDGNIDSSDSTSSLSSLNESMMLSSSTTTKTTPNAVSQTEAELFATIRTLESVIFAAIFILGILLNGLVAFTLVRRKQLKYPSNR